MAYKFSKNRVHEDILREAKVLGLHAGEAEMIADKIDIKIVDWVKNRAEITESDLERKIAEQIKKYNKDLAFLFKNRENII